MEKHSAGSVISSTRDPEFEEAEMDTAAEAEREARDQCTECDDPRCPGMIYCPQCRVPEHGAGAGTHVADHGFCATCLSEQKSSDAEEDEQDNGGLYILRVRDRPEPDYVQHADGSHSTFNLQRSYAERFPTRRDAETATRGILVPLVAEPFEQEGPL